MAVEPTESRVHVGATHTPHTVMGIGAGIPTHFVESLAPGAPLEEGPRGHIAEFLHASSADAVEWAKRVTKMEGMMIGPSSGAVIKVGACLMAMLLTIPISMHPHGRLQHFMLS